MKRALMLGLLWAGVAGVAGAQDILVTTRFDLGIDSAGFVTLREAVNQANATPVTNRILFDPGLLTNDIELLEVNGPLAPIPRDLSIDGRLNLVTVDGGSLSDPIFFSVENSSIVTLIETNLVGGGVSVGAGSRLIMDSAVALTSDADYDGAGEFVKRGIGTLTLTGANTRSGATTVEGGTLVGEVNSALMGDIGVASGAAVDLRAQTIANSSYAGRITGAGRLIKSGTQRLELTSTMNDYTGGTTVNGGTLFGNFSLTGPFAINGSGRLELVLPSDMTLDITGDGTLDKLDAQILTITGSGFSGLANVAANGQLHGTTSSIRGNVALMGNSLLRFSDSGTGSYNGTLTGAASDILRMDGTGTVILAGSTSGFAGPLDIVQGGVQGSSSNIPNVVTTQSANSRLIFNQTSTGTYNGAISGPGSLEKAGSGTLTLGPQTYTGATSVNGGRLNVAGNLPTSSLAVNSGTLGGTGTVVGPVAVRGSVSPGVAGIPGDPGVNATLNTSNAVAFEAGSVLAIGLLQNGTSDRLAAGGAVTIDPGGSATLGLAFLNLQSGVPVMITPLTASGGINGQFADPDLAFTAVNQDYSNSNQLVVTLTPGSNVALAANTGNQLSVANAMDTSSPQQPLADAVNTLTGSTINNAQAQAVLDSITAEVVGDFAQPRLAIARRTHAAAQARVRDLWWHGSRALWEVGSSDVPDFRAQSGVMNFAAAGTALARSAPSPRWGSWLDGYGVFGDLEGNGDSADTDYTVGGLTLGLDRRFGENWLLGGAVGWGHSDVDLEGRSAEGQADTYHGNLYAGYASPLFHVGVSGRYGRSKMETERPIQYLTFDQTADADFGGNGFGARFEAGLNVARLAGIDLQPFVGFDWERIQRDAFDESGSAAYDMHVSENEFDSELLDVGLRVRTLIDLDDGGWMYPELELGYRHEFGDVIRRVDSFLLADNALTPIVARGAEPARDSFVGALRWAVSITENAYAFAGYGIWADSRTIEHQVTGGVRVRW